MAPHPEFHFELIAQLPCRPLYSLLLLGLGRWYFLSVLYDQHNISLVQGASLELRKERLKVCSREKWLTLSLSCSDQLLHFTVGWSGHIAFFLWPVSSWFLPQRIAGSYDKCWLQFCPWLKTLKVLVFVVCIIITSQSSLCFRATEQQLFLLSFPRWQCQPLGVLSYLA